MIELHNIDCMEYLATCEDNAFELAIVDPPYGIDINMNMGRKKGQLKKHDVKGWDKTIPSEEYFKTLFRVSANQIVWGGNYFPLPLTKSWIFWDKDVPDGVSFADGELAWTSYDKTLVKAKVTYTGFRGMEKGGKIHPTQKPVKLYEWLLMNYAKDGDRILDTHLGSGSIAIACHNLGFDLVACELDTDYFNAAQKRLKQHQSQLRIPMQ
jgi:site-specific DNA-methyltransferase (adenine-specific)